MVSRRRWPCMRTPSSLVFYSIAVVALTCGLSAGARWLVTPGSVEAQPIRAPAPIPPRIAESIERRMARQPEQPRENAPAKPAMQEASVSLAIQAAPQFKAREVIRVPQEQQQQKKSRRGQRKEKSSIDSDRLEAHSGQAAVTTARTDFPH